MSENYYYLVAGLPLLEFGEKPPVSYARFLEDCQRTMSQEDFECIKAATLSPEIAYRGKNIFFDTWVAFQHTCCNEIARLRCERDNKDPLQHVRGNGLWKEPFVAARVSEAMHGADPLSRERSLDLMKWKMLDDFLHEHYFDVAFLIVYALKLQILERHQHIASEKGQEIFERFQEFDTSEKETMVS